MLPVIAFAQEDDQPASTEEPMHRKNPENHFEHSTRCQIAEALNRFALAVANGDRARYDELGLSSRAAIHVYRGQYHPSCTIVDSVFSHDCHPTPDGDVAEGEAIFDQALAVLETAVAGLLAPEPELHVRVVLFEWTWKNHYAAQTTIRYGVATRGLERERLPVASADWSAHRNASGILDSLGMLDRSPEETAALMLALSENRRLDESLNRLHTLVLQVLHGNLPVSPRHRTLVAQEMVLEYCYRKCDSSGTRMRLKEILAATTDDDRDLAMLLETASPCAAALIEAFFTPSGNHRFDHNVYAAHNDAFRAAADAVYGYLAPKAVIA